MKTVLIIDDNADVANALSDVMAVNGYLSNAALGPHAGLIAIRDLKPDVVFLDIGMPELNGYQVAGLVRADITSHQPYLIAYSAWDDSGTKRRAILAGFNLHLSKTSPIEILLKAISHA